MNRGVLDDLPTPIPLGGQLPAIYQELDTNVMRLTEAFDIVLAPVWLAVDNLDAYFDPTLAPLDFVSMLASWVGMQVDSNWRESQLRNLVAKAVDLYRWRGTVRGLSELVEAYTGVAPEITESGASAWTAESSGPLPGSSNLAVHVHVNLAPDATEDLARLTRLITENVPAHLAVTVEIVRSGA